ncbi:MAG: Glutamine cyclotransferase, partial [Chloroflexi bacterium]|nr:Glutamine cyclotransferase [Chloroflexota bacterium]
VVVVLDGRPLTHLNELECVGDDVYANVWQTDNIVRIDKTSGQVKSVIDASGLLTAEERRGSDVLNGIAYDESSDTFLITGKNWPKMFEVKFIPAT